MARPRIILMNEINVVGFDPSLRNWGIAVGRLNPNTMRLTIDNLDVSRPIELKGKQVRQNSKDVEVAYQHFMASTKVAERAQAVFVEVPVGSKSARAMASYGICVGVLGAIRGAGIPFFEVTPDQVKKVSVGKKTATKDEMIAWAMQTHPEAPWPMQTQKGVTSVVSGTAEHMADAIAAIYAGMATAEFQRTLSFLKAA